MSEKVYLSKFIGSELEEDFSDFDLTEIQNVLDRLRETDAIDLSHSEFLQQQALRGADILTEYIGKIVKTVSYLEARVNSVKNKAALNYIDPNGNRVTVEMRKWYSETAPEVEDLQVKLAKAKASKAVLDKKYDILIRAHHHYKDISAGLKRTILGYNAAEKHKIADGWE